MRRRRGRESGQVMVGAGNLDKNDRFVMGKCCRYLQRHLARFGVTHQAVLEMTCWLLGSEHTRLGEELAGWLDQDGAREFLEELEENAEDNADYAHIVWRLAVKLKPRFTRKLCPLMTQLLAQHQQKLTYEGTSPLENNLLALQRMLSLTELELELVTLLFIITAYQPAEEFFIDHLQCNRFTGQKYLQNLLGMGEAALRKVLTGTLAKAELVEMDRLHLGLSHDFMQYLLNPSEELIADKLFRKVKSVDGVPLEQHFAGSEQIEHLVEILREKPSTATHVLLYGPPGTGKTSFAHGVLARLEASAFEVLREESNQSFSQRAAILACINMTNSGAGSVILLDEADNLLNTQFSWLMRGETQDKGWLNDLLELPGVRMIWVANHIDWIEPSVLRRFAFSLQFRAFSRNQRLALWDNVLHNNRAKSLLSKEDVTELVEQFPVSAGAVDLVVKKAKAVAGKSPRRFKRAVMLGLQAHQELLNGGEKVLQRESVVRHYSLEGLNIEADLGRLLEQLEAFDHYVRAGGNDDLCAMKLLFHGAPGTGKSELARYLAHHLDREIICRRASDLLDPYVGNSEKNIRRAFAEAESKDAVLVVDEVDSFLGWREKAGRSWEVSLVNEFLTQLERFHGILIGTTNRFEDLDEAALRRFQHKIGFGALKPEGNVIFYEKLLAPLVQKAAPDEHRVQLHTLENLTPGDFRTVRDRFLLYPRSQLNHVMLLDALAEEAAVKLKHKGKRAVGFHAAAQPRQ